MKIEIKQSNGIWLINGKTYKDATLCEQRYFLEFCKAMNYEY